MSFPQRKLAFLGLTNRRLRRCRDENSRHWCTRDHLGGVEAFAIEPKSQWSEFAPNSGSNVCGPARHICHCGGFLHLCSACCVSSPPALSRQCCGLDPICKSSRSDLRPARQGTGHETVVTPHLGLNWKSQRNSTLRTISRLILSRADRIALLSQTQESEISLPSRRPTVAHPNLPTAGGP